ncbi:MAG: bL35 family ribosomal protein [Candidatus Berkelbacteria bacterium]
MKLKTHKATAKRVKLTMSGKYLHVQAGKSHLLSNKANPTKTKLEINKSDIRRIKKLIPNG